MTVARSAKGRLLVAGAILVAMAMLLLAAGVGIAAFVSWTWGGVRPSPEAAMEAVGIGASQKARIDVGGGYVYYTTVADHYENAGDIGEWIAEVTPVRKNGIGMWYATPDPRSHMVYTKGDGQSVGTLITVEADGRYHNFFIPFFEGNDPVTLPKGLPGGYDTVWIDGEAHTLRYHSYFVTDAAVNAFEMGGATLVVGK